MTNIKDLPLKQGIKYMGHVHMQNNVCKIQIDEIGKYDIHLPKWLDKEYKGSIAFVKVINKDNYARLLPYHSGATYVNMNKKKDENGSLDNEILPEEYVTINIKKLQRYFEIGEEDFDNETIEFIYLGIKKSIV